MAQREGAALLLGGMSPAELVAKRKGTAGGSPPPEMPPAAKPDGDEADDTAAVSALHQLADALGVTVKDEEAGVQALKDFVASCKSYDE